MSTIRAASWDDLERLRAACAAPALSLERAAQGFTQALAAAFSTVVLCRVFAVLPFSTLPDAERESALSLAGGAVLSPESPVLALLGSHGKEPAWCNRRLSRGHRAIPLLSAAHVHGIPMVAKLLADLQVDFSPLDDGKPIETRKLLGSSNNTFYVRDARDGLDGAGRHVIAARDFVTQYGVRTVFGMGGAYANGTLVTAIVFGEELLEKALVDRYPSLIGSFKMATSELIASGRVFDNA